MFAFELTITWTFTFTVCMPEDQNKICREVIQMLLIQLYMYLINILLKNITLDIYDSYLILRST